MDNRDRENKGRKAKDSMLYDYLLERYGKNEPILISKLSYGDESKDSLRWQIRSLVSKGKLKRFSRGVYFIPKPSALITGAQLPIIRVIEEKYLLDNGNKNGYVSGINFANSLGLTTQLGAYYEIVTNNTSRKRKITIIKSKVILSKPRV